MNRRSISACRTGVRIPALALTLVFLGAAPSLAQEAAPDGEAIYSTNCAACHQADGTGLPGTFPPLAGSLPALATLTPELVNPDGGSALWVFALPDSSSEPAQADQGQ